MFLWFVHPYLHLPLIELKIYIICQRLMNLTVFDFLSADMNQ